MAEWPPKEEKSSHKNSASHLTNTQKIITQEQ